METVCFLETWYVPKRPHDVEAQKNNNVRAKKVAEILFHATVWLRRIYRNVFLFPKEPKFSIAGQSHFLIN
jgi:hypothetical protein